MIFDPLSAAEGRRAEALTKLGRIMKLRLSMPSRDLTDVVGDIIGRCGTVEALVNTLIGTLGKDSLLVTEITYLPLGRRIGILRELLLDRTTLLPVEVKSICQELKNLAEDRNLIAHNPIVADENGGNGRILVTRGKHRKGLTEFNQVELESVQERVVAVIETLGAAATKIRLATN
jgi:hypothetical protein